MHFFRLQGTLFLPFSLYLVLVGVPTCFKKQQHNFQIMMKDVNNTSVFLEDYFLTRKNIVMASLPYTAEASLATYHTWHHLSLSMTTFLAPFFFCC